MSHKRYYWTCMLLLPLLFACRSRQAVQTYEGGNPLDALAELTRMENRRGTEGMTPGTETNQQLPVSQGTAAFWHTGLQQALAALCGDTLMQTSQLGLCVHDLTDDVPLFSYNAQHRMRPASCQKLVTAITALRCLGPDYQLQTRLYVDGRISGGTLSGNVYVVGGMDPLLTAQDVKALADALRQAGIRRITGHVYKDLSMTDGAPYGWGWCWDDDYGPLTALPVDGKDQFDAVWVRQLKAAQVTASRPTPREGLLPAGATLVHSIAHPIGQLMVPMMKESDNIYAECLFYQIAAMGGKRRASRKDAAALVKCVIRDAGADDASVLVADGSGLSLYNYISPHVFVSLLRMAYQDQPLYQALMPSLPIAGVDGTLEKRMNTAPAFQKVWAKTGSVEGVSSLSGYARAANGHLLAFCIINQGISRFRSAREFQDRVCEALCR